MKIVHCKKEKFDVYIGRPGKYGNPFVIGQDGTREEVIKMYEEWLNEPDQEELLLSVKEELSGKTLGCWCTPPKPCHGDILLKICEIPNA